MMVRLASFVMSTGLLLLVVACGTDPAESGDRAADATLGGDASIANDGSSSTDAGGDGPSEASAPFACGATTCGGTQFCVHPCCGGAGGTEQCTPPPPFCVDDAKDARAVGCMQEGKTRDLACICG